MDKVHVIRHQVLVEGQSIRFVARQLGVSRNMVDKYIKVSEPIRMAGQPKPRPVMEKVVPRIDELLEQWAGRLTAKQRLTGSRVHRQFRNTIDATERVSKLLRINLFPTRICWSDVVVVLKVALEIMLFLEEKDRRYTYIREEYVEFNKEPIKIFDLVKDLK